MRKLLVNAKDDEIQKDVRDNNTVYNLIPSAKSLLVSLLVLISLLFFGRTLENRSPILPDTSLKDFPSRIEGWRAISDVPIDERVIDILELSDFLNRYYISSSGDKVISVYIGFVNQQEEKPLIHTPQVCLPGSGWSIQSREIVPWWIAGTDTESKNVNLLHIKKGEESQMVCYWYQSRGRVIANDYFSRFYLLWDSIIKGRTDGSLVRFMANLGSKETFESGTKWFKEFIQLTIPIINQELPE